MLRFVALQCAFRILNFKHPEVVVLSVKLFQLRSVDLVLQLSDPQVFDLNRVSDRPLQTNWHWWQLVSMLQHLKLSTSVECFTFESEQ